MAIRSAANQQSATLVLYIHKKPYTYYSITGERTKLEDPDAAEGLRLPEKSVRMKGTVRSAEDKQFHFDIQVHRRFMNMHDVVCNQLM